ncbi:enoyl-CoA hydratase/isomerase family protein [Microbispora sp. H11081]|uniref:enoyl-CoA hydratase/isomerase family protein n=1 Tax=Microbispora sp. H11081 TaxID=2729107 RepID=UPI0014739E3F|nr:enoyl-CoA hydratase/isomerase family protein [Microbispora sp. H11081]
MDKWLAVRDLADGAAGVTGEESSPPVLVVDLGATDWSDTSIMSAAVRALTEPSVVVIGVSDTALPAAAADLLEHLTLTFAPGGPGRSWVAVPEVETAVAAVAATVVAVPRASVTLAMLLRSTARIPVRDGLQMESLAFSTLQSGPEFAAWLGSRPRREVKPSGDVVGLARDAGVLTITLNRPERRNAFGREMRDRLIDALELAALDPSVEQVVLRGAGPAFCSGGDLDEFGTFADPATAHILRTARNAGRAVHVIRDRVRAVLHGPCIGAGIEVPAFAGRVEAADDASFRLPELSMGLIPGAGGTVSITRRIGPWRMAYLALTGTPIDVATAIDWGLVDAGK